MRLRKCHPVDNVPFERHNSLLYQKILSLFRPKYTVNGLGWTVEGNFFEHSYVVSDGNRDVVTVEKQWLSWGDSYHVSIANGVDPVAAISVVLVIDACIEASQNNN